MFVLPLKIILVRISILFLLRPRKVSSTYGNTGRMGITGTFLFAVASLSTNCPPPPPLTYLKFGARATDEVTQLLERVPNGPATRC